MGKDISSPKRLEAVIVENSLAASEERSREIAEQAYRDSEERFRVQFKGTPVPIFSWQRVEDDFVLIDFNDAAAALTEQKIISLVGKRASHLYRDTVAIIELFERCFREQSTIRRDGDFRLLSTGELKHLDVSFVFVPPDLVLVHTEDITERKRAEAALRVAERKYRDIFENATEGVFQTTPDGRFIEANPALARMLGFDSPEQLIRERTDLPRQHYVDQNRREEFKRLLALHGVVRGFEYEAYRRDGAKIWMSDNVRSVCDESGDLIYYEGTAEDITERKAAENDLRQQKEVLQKIFDHVPVAISFFDEQGRIKLVNPAWEQTLGWTQEEVLKYGLDLFAAAYPNPEYRQEVLKFRQSSDTRWADFKTRIKDGRMIDMSWAIAHLSDGTHIGIGQDITERKRAQEALQEFSRRLIEVQETERQRIARELHDEIGQVLTAIRLNLQAMQGVCEMSSCIPHIEENIAVVDQALGLVRDLSFDLRPSLLDDLGLVAALRWYVDRYVQRSGLVADVVADSLEEEGRLPREIETAAFRIVQEALTNVARHAQAKRVLVELKPLAGQLILRIKDDGVGFDSYSLRKYAAPIASLGLRGMEERANALGGRLEIDSDAARGTEVLAHLPITQLKSIPDRAIEGSDC